MKWECGRKVGQMCPVWKEKSIAENIELIDCMSADCPYLTIEGYERVPPTSCVGEMPKEPTPRTLTTD